MKPTGIVFVAWLLHMIRYGCAAAQNHFIAGFQTSSNAFSVPKTNVWLEFKDKIHPSKEFTICHWINIKFFNNGIDACLWSYCTVEKQGDPMECLQLCLWGITNNANRILEVKANIPSLKGGLKHWAKAPLNSYLHRTWNHLCWSLSTITGSSKFYHNGDVILSQQGSTAGIDFALKGSSQMYASSFIFGQEPDSLKGGFDSYQAFIGDLSEFNVWNYTLTETNINSMAKCDSFGKGNVVSWEESNAVDPEKFEIHNVEMTKLSDPTSLCDVSQRFVIFPERVQYSEAKEICNIHGGSLAVPHSKSENRVFKDIVDEHKDSCIENRGSANGKLVWLGAEQIDGSWHEVFGDTHHWSNIPSESLLNYTNFRYSDKCDSNQISSNSDCAYLRADGFWEEGDDNHCNVFLYLCTICTVYRQPVVTVKGIRLSLIDWNYYPIIDSKYRITLYEGYRKKSRIHFDEDSQNWRISMTPGYSQKMIEYEVSAKFFASTHPIGRKKWLIRDSNGKIDSHKHSIAISVCDFPLEFTCDSGMCIDMKKRCDGEHDCADVSDENVCSFIHIPKSYDRGNPPKPSKGSEDLEIHIDPEIIKIDSVDTMNMMVTLTMDIRLTWCDGRLSYINPTSEQVLMQHPKTNHKSLKIWTPLRNLIHENYIVGDKIYDGHEIKIFPKFPTPPDPADAIENVIYNGSGTPLELTQRIKIKYDCRFDVKKFPFDEQNCSFIMKINRQKRTSVQFISNRYAVYKGPTFIDQFAIGEISSDTNNTYSSARFTINIHMIRNFTNQMLSTVIPTLILWLFGYSTLFIDMSDFGNRFMGAGTSLLVIATLFSAISNDLPKTSYMKLIDIWFLWHNISILAIISFHILMNRLGTYIEKLLSNDIRPCEAMVWITSTRLYQMKALHQINIIVIMGFPILHGLFYAIYFYYTVY